MLLVMAQPDLGTAMVFGGVALATLFWAGTPGGFIFLLVSPLAALFLSFRTMWFAVYMVALLGFLYLYRLQLREAVLVIFANLAAGTIAVPLWNSLQPYQRNRFLAFRDPYIDPRGAGYHHIQSRIAIGSGGLFGKGFTLGSQKRLAFLPEQHTDFIFGVLAEEGGLVVALLLLVLYGILISRILAIAARAHTRFGSLVCLGIASIFIIYIGVNIGMVSGLLPVVGVPLPFISYGGSALVTMMAALGVVMRVAIESENKVPWQRPGSPLL
jgi:rod shape determining protein RodA